MIVKLYNMFLAWPTGLQNGVIRFGYFLFYSLLTLLAEHYYFGSGWHEAFGAMLLVVLASQTGLSQQLRRKAGLRTRTSDRQGEK